MRPILITALLLSLPFIHGCSGNNAEDNKVTQTKMDDIDKIQGTISDDMINSDETTDEAPVDASAPDSLGDKAAAAAKAQAKAKALAAPKVAVPQPAVKPAAAPTGTE